MEKKINLEEILLSIVPKNCYWEDMQNLTNCPQEYVLSAMKEACRQVLELAAENAETDFDSLPYEELRYFVDKQSILNTIKQIKL